MMGALGYKGFKIFVEQARKLRSLFLVSPTAAEAAFTEQVRISFLEVAGFRASGRFRFLRVLGFRLFRFCVLGSRI